ncbi:MAG: FAD-dependent oxidoreductase [Candidatus Rokuibacteriota bacterium]
MSGSGPSVRPGHSSARRARAYGAVVIGGGVVGLAAAWHLLSLGCHPLAVVERFRIGHGRGSSHGSVRMTRSTYVSPAYASLMRHVHTVEWPRLERAIGAKLVHPGDVVFFGPDRPTLGAYAAAVHAAGADVERLVPAEARRRFPSLRIADDADILHDRTGGIIAAGEAIRALHRSVVSRGADVLEETRVRDIDRADSPIRVVSDRGVLRAERVVIATGAWIRELVPAAGPDVRVVPQTVAYYRLGVPARSLPAWIHFGGAESGITYGVPEVGRDALKAGHHVTTGPHTEPDTLRVPSASEADSLRLEIERILAVAVHESLGLESCFYTMTATEDFVIDHWPGDSRVAFASACSGHGFKFAPLTGRILAELVVKGRAEFPGRPGLAALFALRH